MMGKKKKPMTEEEIVKKTTDHIMKMTSAQIGLEITLDMFNKMFESDKKEPLILLTHVCNFDRENIFYQKKELETLFSQSGIELVIEFLPSDFCIHTLLYLNMHKDRKRMQGDVSCFYGIPVKVVIEENSKDDIYYAMSIAIFDALLLAYLIVGNDIGPGKSEVKCIQESWNMRKEFLEKCVKKS